MGRSVSGWCIAVRAAGLERLCTNLHETLLYAFGCNSIRLDTLWNALTYVGFSDTIPSDFTGDSVFWQRMDGAVDNYETPTAYVNRRKVSEAVKGIQAPYWFAHLEFSGYGNVVLSPAVVDHLPWHYSLIGQNGFVEFDCELQISLDFS